MVITTMQLIQMVVGCLVNIWVRNMKLDGLECNVSDRNIKLSFLMYTSYFVLFGHFFYDKYIAAPSSDKKGAGPSPKAVKAAAAAAAADAKASLTPTTTRSLRPRQKTSDQQNKKQR